MIEKGLMSRQWPTIPQVFIDGEFIGGCDIVIQMHQNGQLEKMLKESKE